MLHLIPFKRWIDIYHSFYLHGLQFLKERITKRSCTCLVSRWTHYPHSTKKKLEKYKCLLTHFYQANIRAKPQVQYSASNLPPLLSTCGLKSQMQPSTEVFLLPTFQHHGQRLSVFTRFNDDRTWEEIMDRERGTKRPVVLDSVETEWEGRSETDPPGLLCS